MKERIITGIVGGLAFLVLLWLGALPYILLISLLSIIGYHEFLKMDKTKIISLEGIIGIGTILFLFLHINQLYRFKANIGLETIIVSALLLFLITPVALKNRKSIEKMGYYLIGALYIGFGFSYMLQTRLLDNGLELTLMVLLATWASDSGAYFSGKMFGKHKLWPAISPNKTIEGSIGGIILAIVVGILTNAFLEIGSVKYVISATLIIAIVGQLGDLVESALKRSKGVKDSGRILPGHGGVLDRFDSLIFTFPVLYLLNIL